ncbi:MAG: flagellar biosynthetic protein FliQ, partial [Pararhodobacter sp.]
VPKIGLMLIVFWVGMSFMTTALSDFYLGQIIPMIEGS